jgi:hypothetical protein
MSRSERREIKKVLDRLQNKAKEEMLKWAMALDHEPTKEEGEAWKAGFIAGLNKNAPK